MCGRLLPETAAEQENYGSCPVVSEQKLCQGDRDWILGNVSSLEQLSSIGTGCPTKYLSHWAQSYLKYVQVSCLGTQFSGALKALWLDSMTLKLFSNQNESELYMGFFINFYILAVFYKLRF